jgi:hypothetical protein
VARYGVSVAHDPNRCEGLLRDTCGKCNREIFVLVQAVRQKVPSDLLAPRHSLPFPLMKGFLVKRLEDELGFSDEAAHWAVESWATALGLQDQQPEKKSGSGSGARPKILSGSIPESENDPGIRTQREQWAVDLVSGYLSTRLDALAGLLHTRDQGSVRLLIRALANDQFTVREAAFNALVDLGEGTIPLLTEALADPEEGIVWRVVLLLGGFRDADTVGSLVPLLERDGRIRECAVWALGEIGSSDGSTALLRLINHPDPKLRRDVETALAKIGEIHPDSH